MGLFTIFLHRAFHALQHDLSWLALFHAGLESSFCLSRLTGKIYCWLPGSTEFSSNQWLVSIFCVLVSTASILVIITKHRVQGRDQVLVRENPDCYAGICHERIFDPMQHKVSLAAYRRTELSIPKLYAQQSGGPPEPVLEERYDMARSIDEAPHHLEKLLPFDPFLHLVHDSFLLGRIVEPQCRQHLRLLSATLCAVAHHRCARKNDGRKFTMLDSSRRTKKRTRSLTDTKKNLSKRLKSACAIRLQIDYNTEPSTEKDTAPSRP